jgi:hypothetical protein
LASGLNRAVTLPSAGAVSSVGRAPARQAGGHWFEPSTAHLVRGPKALHIARFWRFFVAGRHPPKAAETSPFRCGTSPQTSPQRCAPSRTRSVPTVFQSRRSRVARGRAYNCARVQSALSCRPTTGLRVCDRRAAASHYPGDAGKDLGRAPAFHVARGRGRRSPLRDDYLEALRIDRRLRTPAAAVQGTT